MRTVGLQFPEEIKTTDTPKTDKPKTEKPKSDKPKQQYKETRRLNVS